MNCNQFFNANYNKKRYLIVLKKEQNHNQPEIDKNNYYISKLRK